MKQRVAFFDIDGTLFRSSLLVELTDAFIDAGVFPKEAADAYLDAHIAWQNRIGTYEAYIGNVIQSFVQHIRGVHYGVLADIGRAVVSKNGKRVYRYTRDLIGSLKADGYILIAISQSPKTILDDFCAGYGFDKVYGRIYEIGPQDLFTGVILEEHLIANKANIVKRVFDKNDRLTREGCIGVGDTDGDIPLFESVETPICFNPNSGLYKKAMVAGWKIIVERKDVIYELPQSRAL